MPFLVALLIWVIVLGLCFALAMYALNRLPMAEPFKGIAIAILCPLVGYVHTR